MSTYQIVCTTLKFPTQHRHITSVGTGDDPGRATQQWTVAEVRAALARGDIFYTSDSKGDVALVRRYDCACGYLTIRSAPDATTDNNLDYMRQCNWS